MTPRNVSRPILARVVAISLVSNVGALAVGCATTVEMNYAASRGSVSAGFREVSARRIKTTPLAFGRYRSVKTGVDKTKLQYLAFEVKKKASQPAFLFARPPYDLWYSFRAELTCGGFDPKFPLGNQNGIFGLEIDRRSTGGGPLEFYGIFAQSFTTPQAGLNVFVSSHNGNHGASLLKSSATSYPATGISSGSNSIRGPPCSPSRYRVL